MTKLLSFPTGLKPRTSRRLLTAFLLLIMAASVAPLSAAAVTVGQLRCEYLKDPLGIDVVRPRLSWVVSAGKASARGQAQTGYQILVAGTRDALAANQGDLWDSGHVNSDQSIQVRYAGKALDSEQECFWKVRVWDDAGQAVGLERAGALDHGTARAVGLARQMDRAGRARREPGREEGARRRAVDLVPGGPARQGRAGGHALFPAGDHPSRRPQREAGDAVLHRGQWRRVLHQWPEGRDRRRLPRRRPVTM